MVGNVDDISVWLWLLVIIVPLNGFILNRDYERRGEAFSVNSDGIYLERKKKRLAIPWNQVKSCYYRISAEIIGGCFWRIRGVLRISLTLVVDRKTGAENEIKLGVFCCNPITIARCIDGCSGKRLFDWERTKRRFREALFYGFYFLCFCFGLSGILISNKVSVTVPPFRVSE